MTGGLYELFTTFSLRTLYGLLSALLRGTGRWWERLERSGASHVDGRNGGPGTCRVCRHAGIREAVRLRL